MTFAKDQTPPVHGFWSLTLYNEHHVFGPNAIKRYSLGTKNKDLKYNPDGSLTIYVQADPPPQARRANWLPAPDSAAFSLFLRAYCRCRSPNRRRDACKRSPRAIPKMLVWWGSQIECVSALSRLERAAALDPKRLALASERLKQPADGWHEIEPGEVVRESAIRFQRVHPLRAAAALQQAAAFTAAEHRPSSLQFVTLDERLAEAARKEGFAMVGLDAD